MRPLCSQKIVCTVSVNRVSNRKQQDWSGGVGLWPKKRSWVEVGLDAESEKSGTWGWRQEVSSALVEIRGLLREQNGYLEKIAQSLETGKGDEDSAIK